MPSRQTNVAITSAPQGIMYGYIENALARTQVRQKVIKSRAELNTLDGSAQKDSQPPFLFLDHASPSIGRLRSKRMLHQLAFSGKKVVGLLCLSKLYSRTTINHEPIYFRDGATVIKGWFSR